eukprot:symbB.v1.2.001234.t1/scaffold63.1/size477159/5
MPNSCEKLCSSILCAVVGFPLVLIGASVLLGWNEKRDVCEQKAILAGEANNKPVGCTDVSEEQGELVYFKCNLLQTGIEPSTGFVGFGGGEFASMLSSYVGTGIKVEAEMLQCVERTSTERSGNGESYTVYHYDRRWKDTWVDYNRFHDRNHAQNECGGLHPTWPVEVPKTGSYYKSKVMADVWTLSPSLIQKVPLTQTVSGTPPSNWVPQEGSLYFTAKYSTGMTALNARVGDMKIKFKGTDWTDPSVSVLGKNLQGIIQEWIAPNDWLCSGYTLLDLRKGTMELSDMFDLQRAESSSLTWGLRFLGFVFAWIAFCLLAAPLEVAASCIPIIGHCLGNAISAITCCVSCIPATACTLGVIGVVWLVMRPMIAIPLIIIFILVMVAMIIWKWKFAKRPDKVYDSEQMDDSGPGENPGTVVGKQEVEVKQYCGPVDEELARRFLTALRAEYVERQEGAVGAIFDDNGNAEGALGQFEEEVRAAGDKNAAISSIAHRWNLIF